MLTFKELGKWGRLGNQLFQIAAVIGTAKANNKGYCFPKWEHQGDFINYLPECDLQFCKPLQEKGFNYSPLKVEDGNHDLKGYFQSYKYWKDKDILPYFQFKKQEEPLNFVSVHVRRTDYTEKPNYHTNLDINNYYKHIVKHFLGKDILIFSDDIEFCKKHFKGPGCYFSEGRTPIEDLRLMSLCEHNVIANSSFSWWGAYLNKNPDKKVIAPKAWFGPDGPKDTSDLIPKEWIRV